MQTKPLERRGLEIGALRLALGALADVLDADSLKDWNDDRERTADDVIDVLARASDQLDRYH